VTNDDAAWRAFVAIGWTAREKDGETVAVCRKCSEAAPKPKGKAR
jgi:hypothetical protein